MRKIYPIGIKRSLISLLTAFVCTSASAYDFEAGGLYFNILSSDENTCSVTKGSKGYTGEIVIPSQVSYNGQIMDVVCIDNSAFLWCRDLTSVIIPNSVKKIGDSSFYRCLSLSSVKIENGLDSIGKSAFEGCSSLTYMCIPNSVTVIGDKAFASCSSLARIVIGNGVRSMGDGVYLHGGYYGGCSVFSGCEALAEVQVGNVYVMNRSLYCFTNLSYNISTLVVAEDYKYDWLPTSYSCSFSDYSGTYEDHFYLYNISSLKKIICKMTIPPVIGGDGISDAQYNDLDVIVPTESLAAYQVADVWKNFVKLQGGAENYTSTGINPVMADRVDKPATIFDLQGRRHNSPQRGINIIDGKVVIMR